MTALTVFACGDDVLAVCELHQRLCIQSGAIMGEICPFGEVEPSAFGSVRQCRVCNLSIFTHMIVLNAFTPHMIAALKNPIDAVEYPVQSKQSAQGIFMPGYIRSTIWTLKKFFKTAQISLRGQTNGGVLYLLPNIVVNLIYLLPLMFLWKVIAGQRRGCGNELKTNADIHLYQRSAVRAAGGPYIRLGLEL